MSTHTILPTLTQWGETWTNVRVLTGQYAGGNLAVFLESEDGEPLSKVSVNLPDGPVPSLGCFWAKAYSENEELIPALVEAGVLELTGTEFEITYPGTRVVEARLVEPAEGESVRGCSCGMADYGAPGHDGGEPLPDHGEPRRLPGFCPCTRSGQHTMGEPGEPCDACGTTTGDPNA